MLNFQEYMQGKKQAVDERLQMLLINDVPAFSRLYESMRYSLLAGGKRIRPILFLASLEALGKDSSPYLDMACALECIHTYSLIHDDLPAMDNDDLRRGKPTNHTVYGEAMAILAGDGLLTYAFELMARQPVEPSRLAACMAAVAHAAGPAGMVGGQAFDMLSEGNISIGLDGLKLMHRSKTGVIFSAAVACACMVGEASPEEEKALSEYACHMGLTFQITDDILDAVGDENSMGKPAGSDAKNHKATYVTICSLEEARRQAEEAAAQAVRAVEALGQNAWFLKELVSYMLVRVQ